MDKHWLEEGQRGRRELPDTLTASCWMQEQRMGGNLKSRTEGSHDCRQIGRQGHNSGGRKWSCSWGAEDSEKCVHCGVSGYKQNSSEDFNRAIWQGKKWEMETLEDGKRHWSCVTYLPWRHWWRKASLTHLEVMGKGELSLCHQDLRATGATPKTEAWM